MPSLDPHPTKSGDSSDARDDSDRHLAKDDSTATAAQLNRLAELVSNGECAFPVDLPAQRSEQLQLAVREHRRRRLVRFIARQIALDIQRAAEHQPAKGGDYDSLQF